MLSLRVFATLGALVALIFGVAVANTGVAVPAEDAMAQSTPITGPAVIVLANQGRLMLPAGRLWIPQPTANVLLRAIGAEVDDQVLGIEIPQNGGDWILISRFVPANDLVTDDLRALDSTRMITGLAEHAEQANVDRQTRGLERQELRGWVEHPRYNTATQSLTWAIRAAQRNDQGWMETINYSRYVLGRDGYFNVSLVAGPASIAEATRIAHEFLGNIGYLEDKRRIEFRQSLKAIVGYDEAALVARSGKYVLFGILCLVVALAALACKWRPRRIDRL